MERGRNREGPIKWKRGGGRDGGGEGQTEEGIGKMDRGRDGEEKERMMYGGRRDKKITE